MAINQNHSTDVISSTTGTVVINGLVLPMASASVLGGIKVGSGLSIDAGGVLTTTSGGSSGGLSILSRVGSTVIVAITSFSVPVLNRTGTIVQVGLN